MANTPKQTSHDAQKLIASMDAWEVWQTMNEEQRLAVILATVPAEQWYADNPLEVDNLGVITKFRQDRIWWARIKQRMKDIKGNPYDLEKAADAYLSTHRNGPTAPKSPRPSSAEGEEGLSPRVDEQALMDFVLKHRIADAAEREHDTEETQHTFYDQILADAGVKAGWDEAAIGDLIHWANARSAHPSPSESDCQVMVAQARLRTKTGNQEEARAHLLATLSSQWGMRIASVIRHGTENSLWHLQLDTGQEIQIGTSQDLMSQAKVRTKIFDATGHMLKRYKPQDIALWDYHLELLYNAAITIDTPEMTRLGQAKALVAGYLETQYCPLDHDTSGEEREALAVANKPFVQQQMVWLSARHMWVTYARIVNNKMIQSDLLDLLRLLGGKRITIAIERPKKTSRSVWRLPLSSLHESHKESDPLTSLSVFNSEESANG